MELTAEVIRAELKPCNKNRLKIDADSLMIMQGDDVRERIALRTDAVTADKNADAHTRRLYQYMEAVGRSGCVMYGHQNDIWKKAGAKDLSFSDTEDVTGELPGVIGMDALAFTGCEFNVKKYNRLYAGKGGFPDGAIDEEALGTAYANVVAAAKLANYAMARGSVVSLSAHMPNFTKVEIFPEYRKGGETDIENPQDEQSLAKKQQADDPDFALPQKRYPSDVIYARYDFSPYTPNVLGGDVVNAIMPGGAYNEVYLAYLDMIADFAHLLEGPIMFRPFHENTGSWFWWGEAHCTPEEFKALFRYTVDYLRDVKDVHNFLYVYSPGSEPKSPEEFAVRYPGDDYVDMVGVDMYDRISQKGLDEIFFKDFEKQLKVLQDFAVAHDRLMAVTETGLATDVPDEGDNATALFRSGNCNRRWYMDVLDAVAKTKSSYFLLWANFGKHNTFYAPIVEHVDADGTRYGHEMIDDFVRYYNDPRSVFAEMQKETVRDFLSYREESDF